jgi:hypothetical protein
MSLADLTVGDILGRSGERIHHSGGLRGLAVTGGHCRLILRRTADF